MIETIFGSVPEYLFACAILVLAQGVYVLLGFGSGLIAVGGLAIILPEVRDVVVLQLLINLPAEVWVVRNSWRDIQWRGIALVFACIAITIPIGSYALRWGEPTLLLLILGIFLVAAGAAFLITKHRVFEMPLWIAPPVGLLSGLLTGLFGTGGPPLIFYYQLKGLPKAAFRGSLMTIFLAMTMIRVPSYWALGLITRERIVSGLAVMPAVLIGAWLGQRIHLRVEEATFRKIVSITLIVIGGVLLISRA